MSDGTYSWDEFKKLSSELSEKARAENSSLIFRGQGASDWSLETTLERSEHEECVSEYYRLILRIKSEVQTYSERSWDDTPTVPELEHQLSQSYDTFSRTISFGDFPHYAYMAYLRHHGFPSPLLDWSGSPFVAAYFAFRYVPKSENVAIYAFRERGPSRFKTGGSDEPFVRQLGPYVMGPKRHFLQRSQYTICADWNNGSPVFQNHSKVCQPYNPKAEFQQDMIWKFAIPARERSTVLRELANYNLGAFSLFGSEESLMETLSIREE